MKGCFSPRLVFIFLLQLSSSEKKKKISPHMAARAGGLFSPESPLPSLSNAVPESRMGEEAVVSRTSLTDVRLKFSLCWGHHRSAVARGCFLIQWVGNSIRHSWYRINRRKSFFWLYRCRKLWFYIFIFIWRKEYGWDTKREIEVWVCWDFVGPFKKIFNWDKIYRKQN